MEKQSLCACGSGKTKEICCEKMPQMKVWFQPFANPKEHQEFLSNIQIGAQFDMRYRGLVEYYGKDLIAYKREHPSDNSRNDFLCIFSKFLTDNLEDNCPSSWKQCQPPFWEELIFTYFPHCMKITPQEKVVEKFLSQLKKFVRWLDKRAGTSWYKVVEKYAEEASPDLKMCERLLNYLFLSTSPEFITTTGIPNKT